MKRQLQDMVVAITGASAGIGKALAQQLAARGSKLSLCARRLERLEELNRQLGGGHLCVQADVAKREDCEQFVRRTHEYFGRIDTLVCNAGYGFVRTVAETSAEEMRHIFETNVFGTTDCIRAAVPLMEKQSERDGWRGQLMIVSSAAARRGLPFFGPYAATKYAQLGLAEALRVELKPVGIAVTSVHPVGTNTEFFEVAEQQTGVRRPMTDQKTRQSADTVARKMVKGIERPTTELWPLRPARWGCGIATLVPGIVDHFMTKYYWQIVEFNRRNKPTAAR
jgi:3-oxoacyl-[acyl-carrier protein] reductase